MIQFPERLKGVHTDMQKVVQRAAEILAAKGIKIRCQEGLRTTAVQAQYVANGTSWTMNSRHLTGHAVDLLPLVDIDRDGKVELEEMYSWQMAFEVAAAMKRAAVELNVPIVWGGVWDRQLNSIKDPETAVADYVARRRKQNKRAAIDGPHYELDRARYPA